MSKPSDSLSDEILSQLYADREEDGRAPTKAWAAELRVLAEDLRVGGWEHEQLLIDVADYLDGKASMPQGRPAQSRDKRVEPKFADRVQIEYRQLREEGMKPKEAFEQLGKRHRCDPVTVENAVRRSRK
ncbi:hypothetical protein [Mesorhizobium sp. CA7]|uniref:hypothetical protein n=1 Tax=Mesorhizobium sp. CA7 TaxID=588501 RepID=UPI001CCB84FC|nr:hypothetical protein [Mesorhizobium sp. CA7]MBZ9817276.1 hypothetical protein [Mesorhizobium sp. CA7]